MFIRNRGSSAAEEQRREYHQERSLRTNSSTNSRNSFLVRQDRAATKIQSIWRGQRERAYAERRRVRSKPWGYFTHTLALTYLSSARNALSETSTRHTVYLLLEDPGSSRAAWTISIVIVGAILVSIGTFMIETHPDTYNSVPKMWLFLEVICTIVFMLEYIGRLVVCTEAGISRFRFFISPLNLCDLMAVLPFCMDVILKAVGIYHSGVVQIASLVRLIRLVRIVKLGRYASGLRLMGEALLNSTQAISVLVFLLCMGVVLFSSALFHLERLGCPVREDLTASQLREYGEECDDIYNRGVSPTYGLCCTEDGTPEDFPSIVAASWWSMATMTSVGYGEVHPRTTLGKCVGFSAMLVGMVLIALPVAIVGQKFQDIYELHDLEEAKMRAGTRLRVDNKVWSLVPASDVLHRLRHLPIKDPVLAHAATELASRLENVWEQREQLARNSQFEFDRTNEFSEKAMKLLDNMQTSLEEPEPAALSSPRVSSRLSGLSGLSSRLSIRSAPVSP